MHHFLRDFTTKFIERTTDIELHSQFFHTVLGCFLVRTIYIVFMLVVNLVQFKEHCVDDLLIISRIISKFSSFFCILCIRYDIVKLPIRKKISDFFCVLALLFRLLSNLTYIHRVCLLVVYCTASSGYIHVRLWA